MIVKPAPIEALRRGGNGRLELNPDRALVQAWVQGTTRQETKTIAAAGQASDAILVQAADRLSGDFLLTRWTSDQLGPWRATLQRQGSEPQAFMNVPIRIEFLTGFSDDPLYFPTPIYCECRSGVEIQYQNLSADTENQIRFKGHGERYFAKSPDDIAALRLAKFDPRQRPFWLGPDDTAITLTASAANVHRNMTVPSDGDFESEGFWVRSTGPFYLKISESLGGRPVMNGGGQNQVLVYNEHFGGGVYFYRWSAGPAYFKRLTTLDLELTNFMSSSNVVEIVQVGRLLDYPEGTINPAEYQAPFPVSTPGPAVSQISGRSIPPAFAGLRWAGN